MHFLLFPIQNISSNPRVYYKTRTRNSYSKTKLFKVNSLILPAMRFRQLQKVWPRRPLERLIVSAFLGLFPVGYYILIAKVLPELLDYGTAGYIFLWLLGLFLFTNLMSNYVMCMLADPSIDPRTMRRLLEREGTTRTGTSATSAESGLHRDPVIARSAAFVCWSEITTVSSPAAASAMGTTDTSSTFSSIRWSPRWSPSWPVSFLSICCAEVATSSFSYPL